MRDLRQMRVFLDVAENKSFAGAARRFEMTPSTITRLVARLEAELGQQLLVRTTRKVSLTASGAALAARFGPIIDELDRASEETRRALQPDHGRLRIAAPMSFGQRVLPGLITRFRLAYPRIDLSIALSDELVDIVDAPFDLAIRISGQSHDKSTIWRKICHVPRHIIAAPALLQQMDAPKTPDALQADLCMSYSAIGNAETWRFTKGSDQAKVTAGAGVITNNGDLLLDLVREGQGIAALPEFLIAQARAKGEVVTLLPDWTVAPLWLTLFYPPYEQFPPLVATFTEFFEADLKGGDSEGFDWN